MFWLKICCNFFYAWISISYWLRRMYVFIFSSQVMPVNIIQYRMSVRVFSNRDNSSKIKYLNYATILSIIDILNFTKLYNLIKFFILPFQIVLQLYSFTAYSFTTINPGLKPFKVSKNLWKAYLTIHKTDIVCLSETYLDSLFPVIDEGLVIQIPTLSVNKFAFTTKTLYRGNWHSIFARIYKFPSDYWWRTVALYYALPMS